MARPARDGITLWRNPRPLESSRGDKNGHERGLSRADAWKWDVSPRVVRTPNQDAPGSASPDGVERAAPDQGQGSKDELADNHGVAPAL